MTVRVLVADDHSAVRAGLALLLGTDPDIEVVGEAADGAAAVANARALRPDVVLMDVRMPRLDGIEATRQIVAAGWSEVLVLTTFGLHEYVAGAVEAGAAGFLLKTTGAAELVGAVHAVASGQGVLAPEVTREVLAALAGQARARLPEPPGLGTLTAREREVLTLLGEGLSNAQLGQRLQLGEATVKTHVSRVLAKLGVSSRMQAAVIAREVGPADG